MEARAKYLLKEAAIALNNGQDPFSRQFSVEHDVTLDEAFDLADHMATAIWILLAMDPREAATKLAEAIMRGNPL